MPKRPGTHTARKRWECSLLQQLSPFRGSSVRTLLHVKSCARRSHLGVPCVPHSQLRQRKARCAQHPALAHSYGPRAVGFDISSAATSDKSHNNCSAAIATVRCLTAAVIPTTTTTSTSAPQSPPPHPTTIHHHFWQLRRPWGCCCR